MKGIFSVLFSFFFLSLNAQSYWPGDAKEAQASNITLPGSLSPQQQENLNILCRVWGFLKYFHPRFEKKGINADIALFTIIPKVLEVPDKNSLQNLLYDWVRALGEVTPHKIKRNKAEVFVEAGMRWLTTDSLINGKFREQLQYIYRNRNTGNKYYVSAATVHKPEFANEFRYSEVKGEDDGMRMLALFRYWNTIEYFFPSKYLTADNWDDVLKKYIPLFAAVRTDSSYRVACWKLAASIHDTHAGGIRYDKGSMQYQGKYLLPVTVINIDGEMVVLFHHLDSIAAVSPLQPGDKILAINGQPVSKMLDSIKPYIPASNPATLEYGAMMTLCRSFLRENALTIERDHRKMEIEVQYVNGLPWSKTYRYNYTSIYPMYQMIGDDIGYINLEKIFVDSLPGIFRALGQTSGLVIDIRNYPLQFVPFALGKYLKPNASEFVKFTYMDLQSPGKFLLMDPVINGESNPDYYKGKIVILVNNATISQSEYTTMALRTAPGAIVMGSQTAGADGNISMVYLPGGMSSCISGLGVYYPDGKPTQGIGIVPDIWVKPTVKGIAEKRDEVLEKAIQYIRSK